MQKVINREENEFYIGIDNRDQNEMLEGLKLQDLDELFNHINNGIKLDYQKINFDKKSKSEVSTLFNSISKKNKIRINFLGDGLQNFNESQISKYISTLRGLTTAYTPYQPERSQGTLHSIWIYQNLLSKITGFEAINASLYDRSTALFEAIQTAFRLTPTKKIALISEGIFPNDLEVCETLISNTRYKLIKIPLNPISGQINKEILLELIQKYKKEISSITFPQINSVGIIENVNLLTDITKEFNIKSIAIIDPILIGKGGLNKPNEFGSKQEGVDIIVGEGQHLAISPNFGGPGLGIFGVRYNQNNTTDIRQTPGRYIGKTKDAKGDDCLCMILSTREQHIRREKATSNICSNQSFIATLVGASLLELGSEHFEKRIQDVKAITYKTVNELLQLEGVKLAFPDSYFFNEVALEIEYDIDRFIKEAREENLHVGVNISNRVSRNNNIILISFSNIHTDIELNTLKTFFKKKFGLKKINNPEIKFPLNLERTYSTFFPKIEFDSLKNYYKKLETLNFSVDDRIYPLGSCTMKYNPLLNEELANLVGFTKCHPQAPIEDIQGSLEILYLIQERFKQITGLSAVTTQPVAGAQGELVGLKMFQAYHQLKGDGKNRKIILIPKSAHGTNPASAAVAGFVGENNDDLRIILINANNEGQIDLNDLDEKIAYFNQQIAGIMITNPNTSGIFEKNFKYIADMIHAVGGLVYMDGANMNAIAGQINLELMGVDAVHNNLHKTWSIPHGGGGPGDAIVAVSERLSSFLPGHIVEKKNNLFILTKPINSIGSTHRHFGNFAHKVRCLAYIEYLGIEGIRRMSATAVLNARYMFNQLKQSYSTLPLNCENIPRMHEFIITPPEETFNKIISTGIPKSQIIAKMGKLFLDFGYHAPTVAFPEVYGLMIEPTESFSKNEIDEFISVIKTILHLVNEVPNVLSTAPHFTPVSKVDEVMANKTIILNEELKHLPILNDKQIPIKKLKSYSLVEMCKLIIKSNENLNVKN